MPRRAIIVAAALSAGLAAGCNIVGPAALLVHGPEKVPAAHELDPLAPTVIFVDDRGSRVSRRALRLTMAQAAEKVLLENGTLKDVISAQSALSASAGDRDGKTLSVEEIGRAVGAAVVIYAAVDQFSLFPDGQAFAPVSQVRVRVVDLRGKTTWPERGEWRTVVTRAAVRGEITPNLSDQARAEDDLAQQAGLDLARLFIKHERPRGATGNEQ